MTFEAQLDAWLADAEHRHLADLRFPEVSRALRALSATYVERRSRIGEGGALSGQGKRAAFALFYAPLHALMARHIASTQPRRRTALLVDLGCGTGAAGAAWAAALDPRPEVLGIDRHPWAVEEARLTYRAFGLRARTRVEDLARTTFPAGSHVVAGWAVNEIADEARHALLERLLSHAARGGQVTVIEPLAGFVAPWWASWRERVETAGGRADEWRIRVPLPPIVAKLDRAAGLNHREITARSLAL